jgi:hypothetical protein
MNLCAQHLPSARWWKRGPFRPANSARRQVGFSPGPRLHAAREPAQRKALRADCFLAGLKPCSSTQEGRRRLKAPATKTPTQER